MIKSTTVEYRESPKTRRHFKTFGQYTAGNGNSMYMVDRDIVDRDRGNEIFRDLLKRYPGAVVSTNVTDDDDREIINRFRNRIDRHTQYIDDYTQQKSKEDENKRILDIIDYFERLSR